MNLAQHILEHEILGVGGASSGAGSGHNVKYWAYQDFATIASTSITLTQNQNADAAQTPEYIVDASAVFVKQNGNPARTGWLGLMGTTISVTDHVGLDVTINDLPSGSNFRVYWLQYGQPPDGYQEAPDFVKQARIDFLDAQYVDQYQDEEIGGVKEFTSFPILPSSDPTDPQQAVNKSYVDSIFANILVHNEVPTGPKNKINKVFTTAYSFRTNTTQVYLNGLRSKIGIDYTETGLNEITFDDAPVSRDEIIIDYIKTT